MLNSNFIGSLHINKRAEPFISFWTTICGLLIVKFNDVCGFKFLFSSSSSSLISSSSSSSASSSLLIFVKFNFVVLEFSLLCSLIRIELVSIFLLFLFCNFLSVPSPWLSFSLSLFWSPLESFKMILSKIKNRSLNIIIINTSLLNLFQAILTLVKVNLYFCSWDIGFFSLSISNCDIFINVCL